MSVLSYYLAEKYMEIITNVLNFAHRKIQTQKREDTEEAKTLRLGDFAFQITSKLGNRQNRKNSPMLYNEIGKTGMKVSALSFGASSLGGVFRNINESEAINAVFTAIEGGMNFIDVSPYYGHYKAETVLGKALKEIPREKYYLSTKVGRYGKDGVNTWDYSAKRVTDSVYESMERLNIDYIDLINVHDIEFQASLPGGLQKVAEETLPALVELKKKGVVGHVGITDLQPENIKWVIENVPAGTVESTLCFCHYSLNDELLFSIVHFGV